MKCVSLFRCNHQVEVIDKSHCSLTDVPNFQNYSRSLEELMLDANRIKLLTKPLFRLTKLRRLNLSDNLIQSIPPDIANLVNLVELDCSRNDIEHIPEQIKFLRRLNYCDFSANSILDLPNGLVQLTNLNVLTLNNNIIKALPHDFGQLKRLESLELRENELEDLPASFTLLSNLKRLDLGRNLLIRLPEDIGELSQLEELLVDGNELVSLPSQIGLLKRLQCLDASEQQGKTKLKFVPEEIGGLQSLTDLHLSENELDYLPDGIGLLTSLLIFKIDSNELNELNPAIGACVSLQELVLTDNQLRELPQTIGKLTQLTSLNVDRNNLQSLPKDIGNLERLAILSLRDNSLTRLPDEIGHLSQLKVLDLAGNMLKYLPITITALRLSAIWLSENQSKPLLQFQTDELDDGTKILTCYLLPQISVDNQVYNGHSTHQRQGAVKFDDDDAGGDNETDSAGDAQFVRHDTPHPKELKARHQKFIGKTTSSPSASDANQTQNTGIARDDSENYNNSKARSGSNFVNQNILGTNPNKMQDITEMTSHLIRQTSEESHTTISSSALALEPASTEYTHRHIVQSCQDGGDYQDSDDIENVSVDRAVVSFVSGQDTNDAMMPPKGKLHRRDTPHHLKNQRINAPTSEQKKKVDALLSTSLPVANTRILVVQVNLVGTGLGLSIAGGKGTPPFRDDDEGIFVSKVTPGGPTEAAGVMVGDKILAVNDQTFYNGIEHQKAVEIFKRVRSDKSFTLELLRDLSAVSDYNSQITNGVQITTNYNKNTSIENKEKEEFDRWTSPFIRSYSIPNKPSSNILIGGQTEGTHAKTISNLRQSLMGTSSSSAKRDDRTDQVTAILARGLFSNDSQLNRSIIYTTLIRDSTGLLGIEVDHRDGPADGSGENSNKLSNVVIAKILPGSPAAMDGKLQVGDQILSISGVDLAGTDPERVISLLTGTEKFVRIVVARGDCADPIDLALRNMPARPPLGSWYSSSSYMSHRPSLTGSYRRPTFGSAISGLSGVGNDGSLGARGMANSTAGIPSLLMNSGSLSAANKSATMHARLQGLRITQDVPIFKEHSSSTSQAPSGATATPLGSKPPTPPKPRGLLPTKPEDPEVLTFTEKKRRFEKQELRNTTTTTTTTIKTISSGSIEREQQLELEQNSSRLSDAEKRAKWRRERLKSLDDDIQLAQALGNQNAAAKM